MESASGCEPEEYTWEDMEYVYMYTWEDMEYVYMYTWEDMWIYGICIHVYMRRYDLVEL